MLVVVNGGDVVTLSFVSWPNCTSIKLPAKITGSCDRPYCSSHTGDVELSRKDTEKSGCSSMMIANVVESNYDSGKVSDAQNDSWVYLQSWNRSMV